MAECLEGFAAAAAATRQRRRAARLIGAATALREMTGAPVPATERAQYDDMLRRIQQQLSPEGFAREHALGRALSPDQAADYALAGDDAAGHIPASPHEGALTALTRREREVAVLVARGMTNRQIADTLLLGRRTIGTHLEHIFAKLGVQARAEVAAWITRYETREESPGRP